MNFSVLKHENLFRIYFLILLVGPSVATVWNLCSVAINGEVRRGEKLCYFV